MKVDKMSITLNAGFGDAVRDAARRAGKGLIARAGTADPIDATVVLVAHSADRILSSDPQDIRLLVTTAGRAVAVIPC